MQQIQDQKDEIVASTLLNQKYHARTLQKLALLLTSA